MLFTGINLRWLQCDGTFDSTLKTLTELKPFSHVVLAVFPHNLLDSLVAVIDDSFLKIFFERNVFLYN